MESFENNNYISFEELKNLLNKSWIDFSTWWTWKTKTIHDLYKEVEKWETIIDFDNSGKVIRKLKVVWADIFYTSEEWQKYNLRESRQVFNDDRDDRIREFDWSVWEKMENWENPLEAMRRWIKEELWILDIVELKEWKIDNKIKDSSSYPWLESHYYRYWFNAILNDEQFKQEWYIEIQEDKTTYFKWNKI